MAEDKKRSYKVKLVLERWVDAYAWTPGHAEELAREKLTEVIKKELAGGKIVGVGAEEIKEG